MRRINEFVMKMLKAEGLVGIGTCPWSPGHRWITFDSRVDGFTHAIAAYIRKLLILFAFCWQSRISKGLTAGFHALLRDGLDLGCEVELGSRCADDLRGSGGSEDEKLETAGGGAGVLAQLGSCGSRVRLVSVRGRSLTLSSYSQPGLCESLLVSLAGAHSGSGSARLDLSQKGDLPSSDERAIFIWSKVADAR
jgi:hypothetical protein